MVVATGDRLDTTGQTQATEFAVKDLVELYRSGYIVSNLDAGCQSIKLWVEITFQDADTAVPTAKDLVPFEHCIRLPSLDPHAGHSIVKDLVLF